MPIYEFYCSACHMIFNFFSGGVNTDKRPLCPRCGKQELQRQMSVFSSPRHRGADDDMPLPDMDESKMEQAMQLLSREAENVDEDDSNRLNNIELQISHLIGRISLVRNAVFSYSLAVALFIVSSVLIGVTR